MAPKFGTDGIRGIANQELSPELALALGRAVAEVFTAGSCVVGRDTRRSGSMLVAAVVAGLTSEGVAVSDLGVAPTPAVAHLAATLGVPGVVVSASHNPFADNGIKVFAPGGVKLSPAVEADIEARLGALLGDPFSAKRPSGAGVGVVRDGSPILESYEDHILSCIDGRSLEGLSVVVDAANGACWDLGPRVLRRLGADVSEIHSSPDGFNINNDCGSTSTAALSKEVLRLNASLGVAFDGDADRLVAVDHLGHEVDGDHLMALFARDLKAGGFLANDAVAVTVMTNIGFHKAMEAEGIGVVQTPVGDRFVLDAIEEHGLALGGEQSGHIIFRRLATTGDGLLTAVMLADLLVRSGRSLAELSSEVMTRLPQRLINVGVVDPGRLGEATELAEAARRIEERISAEGGGRVLLRPSGTEPLVRVMVEAASEALADQAASELAEEVRRVLGREDPFPF